MRGNHNPLPELKDNILLANWKRQTIKTILVNLLSAMRFRCPNLTPDEKLALLGISRSTLDRYSIEVKQNEELYLRLEYWDKEKDKLIDEIASIKAKSLEKSGFKGSEAVPSILFMAENQEKPTTNQPPTEQAPLDNNNHAIVNQYSTTAQSTSTYYNSPLKRILLKKKSRSVN